MKIFLVSRGEYDDYRIVGAFSTRAKAKAFINESDFLELMVKNPEAAVRSEFGNYLHDGNHDFGIEELELDSESTTEWRLVKDIGCGEGCGTYVLKSFIQTVDLSDPPEDCTQSDVDEYAASISAVSNQNR